MKVLAAGIGARAELINGNCQAGIVFQTSWTVGLLLVVRPQSRVWPSTLIGFANRMSTLSQAKRRLTPSYVPWMNAPRLSVNLPPVKRPQHHTNASRVSWSRCLGRYDSALFPL